MKTAIFSDIHANWEALEAVLKDIDAKGGVDQYWCLGDVTDYGPNPHECLTQMRQLKTLLVLGNHDAAVSGKLDYRKIFSFDFVSITSWTEEHLTPEDKAYLGALPLSAEVGDFTLVHGSPRDPLYEYVLDREKAALNLPYLKTRYCLIGHTHVSACFEFEAGEALAEPVLFSQESGQKDFKDGKFNYKFQSSGRPIIKLNSERMIINPGAVGQQRDRDPRAAYGAYNSEQAIIELRRVEYNVEATHQKMLSAGLPERLGQNLLAGI